MPARASFCVYRSLPMSCAPSWIAFRNSPLNRSKHPRRKAVWSRFFQAKAAAALHSWRRISLPRRTPKPCSSISIFRRATAAFLGLEAKYSIADMVEKRQRLDETLINSLVTQHSTNLWLLAAPREADSADEIEPQHVLKFYKNSRTFRLRRTRSAAHLRLHHARRARSV